MSYLSIKARNGETYQIKKLNALPKMMQEVILDHAFERTTGESYAYSAVLGAFTSKSTSAEFQVLPWPIKRDFILEAIRLWKNDWVSQMTGEEPDLVY
jgi:hypothetical protein